MVSRLMLMLVLLALPVLLEGLTLPRLPKVSFKFRPAKKVVKEAFDKATSPPIGKPNDNAPGITFFVPTEDAFNKIFGDTHELLTDEYLENLISAHLTLDYIPYNSLSYRINPLQTLLPQVSLRIDRLGDEFYVSSERSSGRILDSYNNATEMFAAYLIDAVLYVPTPAHPRAP